MKTQVNRRKFLQISGLTGAGLMLGFSTKAGTEKPILSKITPYLENLEINPFIIIEPNNKITLINPRPDMGQGSIQAVPSLLAEELGISLSQVTIISSDGRSKYGAQQSGGSSSVRELWKPLRSAGAAAREMLTEVAAKRWAVPAAECSSKDGFIWHLNSNRKLTFGELAEEAAKLPIPKNPKLKEASKFDIIGKYNRRLDVPDRVTGKAVYGIDVEVPGMVYAAVLHAPMVHSKIKSINDADALKVPGVQQVIKSERSMPHTTAESVAVIATNWWAAQKGRKALKVEWDNGQLADNQTTDAYFAKAYDAAQKAGINHMEKGDFTAKFSKSKTKLEATYETPFLAHAMIEPENAVAHVKDDGSVEIWAPVQGPDSCKGDIAGYMNLKPEQVHVNVSLLGGSFGRKAYYDFVREACFISKAVKKPVKLIWTREDDLTQGPYRPGMLSHMQGFTQNSKIAGFHHHAIGESIMGQVFKYLPDGEADPWLSEEISSTNNKYEFAVADKVSFTRVETQIPIVWWRSVYASNFGWGQECFIDELAHASGKDPLQARLEIINDERFKTVLNTLAEKAGYGQKLPEGHGRGIAVFKSFGSISAACVQVAKTANGITIEKVTSVIDCGFYVNPDMVKAQTEGNIVMGISAAIKGGITFTKGQSDQTNYDSYQVLRMNETPAMEVIIIDSGAEPGGVGEPGLPPIAPALGNAIFAATGKRIRKLPMDLAAI